jgi:hypothetical protein
MARFRPSAAGSVSLRVGHHHTVLPRVWWQDWVLRERSQRGLVLFEEEAVGTRRTNATLRGNLRVFDRVNTYLVARYDRRHNDDADAFQGRGGVKLLLGETGFVDVYYSYRHHFTVDNHIGSVRCGLDFGDTVSFDSGVIAMHTRNRDSGNADMLYDVDAGLWLDLGRVTDALSGLRLLVHYLGFVEPGLLVHWGHIRLSYRLDA